MLRNAVSAYGARLSLGAAAVAAPVAVAQCAKDDKKSVTSSFDPEALERGAKALREINSSVHAKRVRPGRRGIGRRRHRALDRRAFARRFADRRDRSSRADRAPVFFSVVFVPRGDANAHHHRTCHRDDIVRRRPLTRSSYSKTSLR